MDKRTTKYCFAPQNSSYQSAVLKGPKPFVSLLIWNRVMFYYGLVFWSNNIFTPNPEIFGTIEEDWQMASLPVSVLSLTHIPDSLKVWKYEKIQKIIITWIQTIYKSYTDIHVLQLVFVTTLNNSSIFIIIIVSIISIIVCISILPFQGGTIVVLVFYQIKVEGIVKFL